LLFFGEISGSRGGDYEDVFWDVAPYSLVEVHLLFRDVCCLHHQSSPQVMEVASISETSANLYQTPQHNPPEDNHLHYYSLISQ
jgi:hypothetical protein